MTSKELKHMSRSELLEMLIALTEENEALSNRLQEAEAALQSRQINLEKAGTIAEAALLLNGVIESTEKAAEQYLENIRELSGRQEQVCEQMEQEAREKADAIIAEAEAYSSSLRSKTHKYCKKLINRAQAVYEEKTGLSASAESEQKDKAHE